mgnify:CR=1 FL=1
MLVRVVDCNDVSWLLLLLLLIAVTVTVFVSVSVIVSLMGLIVRVTLAQMMLQS